MLSNRENRGYCLFGKWSTQLAACLLLLLISSQGMSQELVKASAEVLDVFGLTEAQVVQLDVQFVADQPVVESVVIDGEEYVFELFPRSIRSDNFVLKVQVEDGSFELWQPEPSRTFRGTLRGSKGSRVAGSVTDDGLGAKIVMGDGRVFFIEPISSKIKNNQAFAGSHVVYRSGATVPHDAVCGVGDNLRHWEEIRLQNERRRGVVGPVDNGTVAFGTMGGLSAAEVGVDADFEFFSDYGTVQNTMNRMEQVLNIVNDQYETQVSITHVISGAIVRTSEPDPYSSTNAGTLLDQVRTEWLTNQGSVQRDVVHMFTGKNIQGGTIGVAFLGTICNTNLHYGLVESDCCGALVCTTDLSAHELGHNWNAGHCNCPGNTMNAGLTCSNNFTAATINAITSFRNSRNCLDGSVAPGNDNFVESVNQGPLPSTEVGTNVNATTEAGESELENTGSTVWWFATAPADGMMTVNTFGSTFDTVLQVFTGNSVTNLTAIAGNDDADGTTQSQVSFPVDAGQRYEIRVGGFTNGGNPASGSVQLSTSFAPEGPTDFFLSLRDSGAFNTSNAEAAVTTGTSGSIYVYYDPTTTDIDTGAFFDIQTSTAGVIEFTGATAFDFDIITGGVPFAVRWGDAFGETGTVTPDFIDEWGAFTVVSGQGMLGANTGPTFFDDGYDPLSGAFLFGRIDFNVVGAVGSQVDIIVGPGTTGIVHMGNTADVGVGSISLTVEDPLPPMTDFFWSFADLGGGAVNDSMPVGTFGEGASGSMYLYYDPIMSDIDTGAFFDLETSTSGIIEFTNATAFDFDITTGGVPFAVRWGDAFGETGTVTSNFIDEWGAFTVISGQGILSQNAGPTFFDEGFDMSSGTFLFGRVDFTVVGVEGDTVDVVSTAGATGIVHMGMDVGATLGRATIVVGEPFVLGDINCDGVVDLLDVQPFVDLLTNGEFSPKADFNGDEQVTLLDVQPFVNLLSGL